MKLEEYQLEKLNREVNTLKKDIGANYEMALAYYCYNVDKHAFDEWLPKEQRGNPSEDVVSEGRKSYAFIEYCYEKLVDMFETYPICYFETDDMILRLLKNDEVISICDNIHYPKIIEWINDSIDKILEELKKVEVIPIVRFYDYGRVDAYDLEGDIFIKGMGDGRYYSEHGIQYRAIIINGYLYGFIEL